jgi:carbonic anhydrase
MFKKVFLFLTAAIVDRSQGAGGGWVYDYSQNGDDWATITPPEGEVNYCATDNLNQSPINLMSPLGSYGWAYGLPVPKEEDNHDRNYIDIAKSVSLEWATNTLKVSFAESETSQMFFKSDTAAKVYGASTDKFNPVQFHFHSPSEHTHNGKHYDLEMHVVHLADFVNATTRIKYAAVGLMFDVLDYDKTMSDADTRTVERFFEHLKFGENGNPIVDFVAFGQLMEL